MSKLYTTAILLLLAHATVYAADDTVTFTCPEWHSARELDMNTLDKLKKKSSDERPESGFSYTKTQFVVLLAVNQASAKNVLETGKGKLPKTPEGLIDLTGMVMNGFDLSGLNFDQVDFKGTELNGANLSGSSFRHANFYKAELEGANLNHANFHGANLVKAKLSQASLCQTQMHAVDLEGASLNGAYLRGATLDFARNLPKSFYPNAQAIFQFGLSVPAE